MKKDKILFISHDAIQAGAPILFLTFLKWFKQNSHIPFRIILRNGGGLTEKFEELATVNIFNLEKYQNTSLFNKIINSPQLQSISKKRYLRNLYNQIACDNIKLIYSNTITNGEVLHFLSSLNIPVITHVHELEYWINRVGKTNFDYVKKYSTHYVAVSQAVKSNLMINHNIPEDKIDVVYGFIPQSDIAARYNQYDAKLNIIKELGIEDNSIIVGCCGQTYWAKSPDLFIQLALIVRRNFTDLPIHFIWIGSTMGEFCYQELKHDITRADLKKNVHFLGHKSDSLQYLAGIDIFTLVSREDSFPLVILEAALLGKPILCFENAGGAQEFVEKDSGFIVPYLDVNAMASKVIMMAKDSKLMRTFGENAFHKVMKNHNIDSNSQQIVDIINRFL